MEKRFIEQTGSDTTRQLVWEQKDEPIRSNTDRCLFHGHGHATELWLAVFDLYLFVADMEYC